MSFLNIVFFFDDCVIGGSLGSMKKCYSIPLCPRTKTDHVRSSIILSRFPSIHLCFGSSIDFVFLQLKTSFVVDNFPRHRANSASIVSDFGKFGFPRPFTVWSGIMQSNTVVFLRPRGISLHDSWYGPIFSDYVTHAYIIVTNISGLCYRRFDFPDSDFYPVSLGSTRNGLICSRNILSFFHSYRFTSAGQYGA